MRPLTAVPSALLDLAERQAGLVSAAQCDAYGVNANRRSRLVDQGRW
ncbi:type IV toxin-antitoxin system AbiEi family antitoxin domain-containing protein [Cellulosimicrobium sp. TH-20]|nr:type IV toxin-antitoxin system AbiEi family antitoxin domain-containing protein [Cellulosimicrobium sp. TH-20]